MFFFSPRRRWSAQRLADLGAGVCLGVAIAVAAQVKGEGREVPPSAPEVRSQPQGFRATALSVLDGDTFEARVTVFPGQEIVTRVRLAGIDAPERRGRCAGEKAAAEAATRALRKLVDGRPLTLTDVEADKYFGRVVARVASGAGDVAEALMADGHARPYEGGRRAGWC